MVSANDCGSRGERTTTQRTDNPPPQCGDAWVCHEVIALREIAQATACTAKKRSKLIMDGQSGHRRLSPKSVSLQERNGLRGVLRAAACIHNAMRVHARQSRWANWWGTLAPQTACMKLLQTNDPRNLQHPGVPLYQHITWKDTGAPPLTQGPLPCALQHRAGDRFPSPLHHSTGRRDTFPSPSRWRHVKKQMSESS